MRTVKLLAVAVLLVVSSAAEAQVSVNVNIGSRPVWAPAQGYAAVDYYYIPEIHAYYDTHASQYVYLNANRWVRSRTLPTQYRNVNLNHCHTVALSGYRGMRPYDNYSNHREPQRVVYVERGNYKNDRYYNDHDHHDYKKGHDSKKYKKH